MLYRYYILHRTYNTVGTLLLNIYKPYNRHRYITPVHICLDDNTTCCRGVKS